MFTNFKYFKAHIKQLLRLSLSLNIKIKPFWLKRLRKLKPYEFYFPSFDGENKGHSCVTIIRFPSNRFYFESFGLTLPSTIKMAILSGETRSIEDISELTDAGTACRACICRIERISLGFPSFCGECTECPALNSDKIFGKSIKIM